jgi:hypothetical protein
MDDALGSGSAEAKAADGAFRRRRFDAADLKTPIDSVEDPGEAAREDAADEAAAACEQLASAQQMLAPRRHALA